MSAQTDVFFGAFFPHTAITCFSCDSSGLVGSRHARRGCNSFSAANLSAGGVCSALQWAGAVRQFDGGKRLGEETLMLKKNKRCGVTIVEYAIMLALVAI